MGDLGELVRHGALVVPDPGYRESAEGPLAVTVLCADGSLLQVFTRRALESSPEVIERHQQGVREKLDALRRDMDKLLRRVQWAPRVVGFVFAIGGLVGEPHSAWAAETPQVPPFVWSTLWCALSLGIWAGVRYAVRCWARRAVREALQRWIGGGAPAVTGSPRS